MFKVIFNQMLNINKFISILLINYENIALCLFYSMRCFIFWKLDIPTKVWWRGKVRSVGMDWLVTMLAYF